MSWGVQILQNSKDHLHHDLQPLSDSQPEKYCFIRIYRITYAEKLQVFNAMIIYYMFFLASKVLNLSPILVMRCLNSLVVIVPEPSLSSTLNAIRSNSSSPSPPPELSLTTAIILQNSGNSICPLLSVSNCINIFQYMIQNYKCTKN